MNAADFMQALRECCLTTVELMKRDTATAGKAQDKAFAKLIALALGRKPTAEELAYVTLGADEMPPAKDG